MLLRWRPRSAKAPDQPAARRRPPEELPPALLRRLQWTVLRPVATRLGGDERSTLRGPGLELTEVREYQPGDDVRHIDWNITARTDTPYVRESYAERALDVWLLLDLSASIDWGTARCLKRDRLIAFVAAAGRILGQHGHRLGAILFDDRPVRLIPPAAGRGHVRQLVARLREQPRQASAGPAGRTDLAAALAHLGPVLRRRSLVIVVSDFLVPDGWQQPLGRLAARHEVVAARLSDPREVALPDVGVITLEDPETGRQRVIDTGDRRLRERFAAAADAQTARVRADLAACGVDTLWLDTDEDLLCPLVRFLDARRLRRRSRVVG
jgi:uncharacterized protein (DUF58 family)